MSGKGSPAGLPDARGLSLAVVATRWYGELTDAMVANAVRAAEEAGADATAVVRVPGAVELPVVAAALAARMTPWSPWPSWCAVAPRTSTTSASR